MIRAQSRQLLAFLGAATCIGVAANANAYRPFDGTEADVTEPSVFELELGPAHYLYEQDTSYWIAPAGVLNLGLLPRVELVVDFKNLISVGAAHVLPAHTYLRLRDADVLLKTLLVRGSLQGGTGPSLAIEAGLLVPDTAPRSGFGAQADVIFSHATATRAIHVNALAAFDRDHQFEYLASVILEGWRDLRVHPVAELLTTGVLGEQTDYSVLLGALWTRRENLVLDAGARLAWEGGHPAWELRLGLTWSTHLWAARAGLNETRATRVLAVQ